MDLVIRNRTGHPISYKSLDKFASKKGWERHVKLPCGSRTTTSKIIHESYGLTVLATNSLKKNVSIFRSFRQQGLLHLICKPTDYTDYLVVCGKPFETS